MLEKQTDERKHPALFYLVRNEGADTIVFFIHGNSGSAGMWKKQLNDERFTQYTLIAPDLPSHGRSGPLPANDHNLPMIAGIMKNKVLELAGDKPYALVGFSLGASIVAEMLKYGLKPAGIVLISPTITGVPSIATGHSPGRKIFYDEDATKEEIESSFRTSCLAEDAIAELISSYQQVKVPFRSALRKSVLEGKVNDELVLLKENGLPLLMIFGSDDPLISPDSLDNTGLNLWKDQIYKIPAGSHYINIDQPMIVNSLISGYLSDLGVKP